MKKLLIIITLFVSSFFLFCNKEVKADITITDSDISTYITEDFLASREALISNGFKYVVIYYQSMYQYFVFDDTDTYTFENSVFRIKSLSYYKWNNGSLSLSSSNYTLAIDVTKTKIIDSSFDLFSTNSFNVIYNDKTYSVGPESKFMTLYDIYSEINNVPEENPHQEEIDKLTNFYTMVIEKISYLAEQISSNYILLSIIGIFIATFVFLLIFRRFL